MSRTRCQTVSKAYNMSSEMALISFLALRTSIHCIESRSSMSRVERWLEIKPLVKRKDLMSEAMMDSMTMLMIGRRLIGL